MDTKELQKLIRRRIKTLQKKERKAARDRDYPVAGMLSASWGELNVVLELIDENVDKDQFVADARVVVRPPHRRWMPL